MSKSFTGLNGYYDELQFAEYAPYSDWVTMRSPIDGQAHPYYYETSKRQQNILIDSAVQCFLDKEWSSVTPVSKKLILLKWADLIDRNAESLALIDCIGTGRPITHLRHHSLKKATDTLRWFAECSDKLQNGSATPLREHSVAITTREPLGVISCILPWNDPLVVFIWRVAPALVMGNSVIVKPSEHATKSIIFAVELAWNAGVPRRALAFLSGSGGEVGMRLVSDRRIDKVLFTGSSQTGRRISVAANRTALKPLGLECGGKSAFVITEHCNDVRAALDVFFTQAYYNAGQICSAPTRLILHESLEWLFKDRFQSYLSGLTAGNPLDPSTSFGTMVSHGASDRLARVVSDAKARGVTFAEYGLGGMPLSESAFHSPLAGLRVDESDFLWRTEIFGPLIVTKTFKTISEAIRLTNNSPYGLAAGIFSDDLSEVAQFIASVRVGIVHVNSYGDDDESVPFGGIKQSGYGKDKGMQSFEESSFLKATVLSYLTTDV